MIRYKYTKYTFGSRMAMLALLCIVPFILGAQTFVVKVDKHANCDDVGGAASISGIKPDAHIVWWTNASGDIVGHSPSVTGLKSGTYFATVMLISCAKDVYRGTAKIKKTPGFDVNISASGSIVKPCEEPRKGSVTLTANIIGGTSGTAYKYRWSTGKTSKSITVKDPGSYSVSVSTSTSKCDATDNVTIKMKQVECSHDPNDIRGPEGFGSQRFVSASSQMNYTIRFENDPVFATAPAKKVTVTLPLNEHIKLGSFRLSNVGFGSFDFTIPENTLSHTEVYDVSDSLGVLVRLTSGVNVVNKEAFWIFESIDPETGTDPENALLGFLLVNDSIGRGEGFVSFSMNPSSDAMTGDTIFAKANIVFDENASIETNMWYNTVDAGLPSSGLKDIVTNNENGQLSVSFDASDDTNGAGVKDVILYVAENDEGYTEMGKYTPDSIALFSGVKGNIYNFFTIAEDNAGNREALKSIHDYQFNISESPTGIWLSNDDFNEFSSEGTIVGAFTTRGNDFSESYTYNLVSGDGDTDNALFGIEGDQLVTAAQFDCMPDTAFSVRIQTTNFGGFSYQQKFNIFLNNKYSEKDTLTEYIVLCEGEEIQKEDTIIALPGEYILKFNSYTGCDSIVRLYVTTLPSHYMRLEASFCEGSAYDFNGTMLNAPGVYYDSLTNMFDCDSIVELTLMELPVSSSNITATICQGDTYDFYGQTLSMAGSYSATLKNSYKCDSIVNLTLSVNNVDTVWIESQIVELLNGATYNFLGDELSQSGTYYKTFEATNGCDSVVAVQIAAGPIAMAGADIEAGEGTTVQIDASASSDPDGDDLTYLWNSTGISFQNSNAAQTSFIAPMVDADSVITIQLTVSDGSLQAIDEIEVTVLNSVGLIDVTEDGRINIWPNPAKDKLFIATKAITVEEVQMIDATGKIIIRAFDIGNEKTLLLNDLVKGLYTVVLITDDDVFVTKVIVQ